MFEARSSSAKHESVSLNAFRVQSPSVLAKEEVPHARKYSELDVPSIVAGGEHVNLYAVE